MPSSNNCSIFAESFSDFVGATNRAAEVGVDEKAEVVLEVEVDAFVFD